MDPAQMSAQVGALAIMDRQQRLPLVESLLRGEQPMHREIPSSEATSTESLESWNAARTALCHRLEELGPEDWERLTSHATRGALSLAEVVREWVDLELEQRRSTARAIIER